MPELPEVETIRRDLEKSIEGKSFKKIIVFGESSVEGSKRRFSKKLEGLKIKKLDRRAKLLIFNFDQDDIHLLVHLKMTGQLIHCKGTKVLSGAFALSKQEKGLIYEQQENPRQCQEVRNLPDNWTRVQFLMNDESSLFFNDIRRFGYLKIVNAKEKQSALDRYGIEPLTKEFTTENFHRVFKGRTAPLKSLLLNQQLVAGLGNIYVDEICFFAGVRPTKRVNRLTKKEIDKLHKGCEVIIKSALKNRGTSFSDYRDAKGEKGNNQFSLKTYGRVGKPCYYCGNKIVKITLSGRGTSYCRKCQH